MNIIELTNQQYIGMSKSAGFFSDIGELWHPGNYQRPAQWGHTLGALGGAIVTAPLGGIGALPFMLAAGGATQKHLRNTIENARAMGQHRGLMLGAAGGVAGGAGLGYMMAGPSN